jgi:hypothetical protein
MNENLSEKIVKTETKNIIETEIKTGKNRSTFIPILE